MVIRKWIFSHFCNKSKQSVYAFSRSSDAYEMRRMENYNSFQLCEGEITQMTKGVRWDFIICCVLTKNRLAKLRLGDVEWRSWKIGYFVTARHYLCFVLAWCHVRQVNEVHFREENLKIFTLQKHCVRATEFHSKIPVCLTLEKLSKGLQLFHPNYDIQCRYKPSLLPTHSVFLSQLSWHISCRSKVKGSWTAWKHRNIYVLIHDTSEKRSDPLPLFISRPSFILADFLICKRINWFQFDIKVFFTEWKPLNKNYLVFSQFSEP